MTPRGFVVTCASDGPSGVEQAVKLESDLVLLDLMLPGKPGLEVLQEIRAVKPRLPVIALTALGDTGSKVGGLEAGADDYLPKPFDPRELILRINNILRRGGPAATPKVEQLVFGPYTFQIARRELKRGGEPLKLTDREQEILAIFAGRAGETIPRHELVAGESDVGERTIDVQINRLRRKIERDPSNPVWLQTVRGIGYRLSVE
ncbi:MAG: response regulator transcription factor [Pseudomonadota bacterium]|nr:response regulator transcription factor [Pseudomonadota bacterium]